MDGQKFDKLTRAFAAGTDRRTLLKIFGGATVATAAAVALPRTNGVFAQGGGQPGDACFADEDCAQGFCVIQGDPGAEGICACTESGLGDPWFGCVCTTGTLDPCGDSNYLCCETGDLPGGSGVCQSECDPVDLCSEPGTSCEESGCCTVGTCGANGWCTACYSGTADPCGGINEAFGADYICCTEEGAAPGAVGYCTEADLCVEVPPVVGAGTTAETSNWIAPAAAVGAAAAVLAYKSRESKVDSEA